MSDSLSYRFDVIGTIHSCYTEKFGIPRQPGLSEAAEATLELLYPFNRPEAVKGMEAFSHIWIAFVFHGVTRQEWKPTVRPPRLGGNQRLGVFATRSTHRPNPLGLSVVELLAIENVDGKVVLHLRGADLLDGTPVLDIKPYIPYADSKHQASAGFADAAPQQQLSVNFSEAAKDACRRLDKRYPKLQALIVETLALDPRPAYQAGSGTGKEYGMSLYGINIRFRIGGNTAEVFEITESKEIQQ